MPEDSTANPTPDAAENTAPEPKGEPTSEAKEPETDSNGGDGRSYSQADLDRITAKVRREEKAKFEKQLSQSQLSEAERLKAENEQLRHAIRSRDAERQVFEAVKSAGADDPEVVSTWIQSKLQLEYEEDGKIANLRDLIHEAKERIPNRFPKRPGGGNGADGGHTAVTEGSMNAMIRRAANRF